MRCKLVYVNEGFVLIFRITQREGLANSQHCNNWIIGSVECIGEISWNLCEEKYYGSDLM